MVALSVVVITSGGAQREESLRTLLATLSEKEISGGLEVVLVDQSQSMSHCIPPRGRNRIHYQPSTTRGASRARNVGSANCEGEVITWADDDVMYAPGALEQVVAAFEDRGIDAAVLGVEIEQRAEGLGVGQAVMRLREMDDLEPLGREDALHSVAEFGIAMRRSVVEEGYDFTAELGVGSGSIYGAEEGPDVVVRLVDAGKKVVALQRAVVVHPPLDLDLTTPQPFLRYLLYGAGRGAVLEDHRFGWRVTLREFVRPAGGFVLFSARRRGPEAAVYGTRTLGMGAGWLVSRLVRRGRARGAANEPRAEIIDLARGRPQATEAQRPRRCS